MSTRKWTKRRYAQFLEIQIAKDHTDATPQGTPADWANESHRFAEGALLQNGGLADQLYFDHEISVLDVRLELAGLRLASVLNRCLSQPDDSTITTKPA